MGFCAQGGLLSCVSFYVPQAAVAATIPSCSSLQGAATAFGFFYWGGRMPSSCIIVSSNFFTKSSESLYVRLFPCTSASTMLCSFSTARCWDITGCGWSRQVQRSDTQGSFFVAMRQRSLSLMGCPHAFSMREYLSIASFFWQRISLIGVKFFSWFSFFIYSKNICFWSSWSSTLAPVSSFAV